ETLFIVIHQVYELWFKQLLHELDHLRVRLEHGETMPALATFKRILTILKVAVAQIDILETMTPLDFLSFRARLESGSGFQSFQFREFEFVLGVKDARALERAPAGSPARARLEQRLGEPTLWDSFLRYLVRTGHPVPAGAQRRDVRAPVEPSEELQQVLIALYRKDPMTA